MSLTVESPLREVTGLSDLDEARIKAYLQGAIYSWVKNCERRPFAARDLVGGVNNDWYGTPLYALYAKQLQLGKQGDEAEKAAGIDLGWLLKTVANEDKRQFEKDTDGLSATYRWTGVERNEQATIIR